MYEFLKKIKFIACIVPLALFLQWGTLSLDLPVQTEIMYSFYGVSSALIAFLMTLHGTKKMEEILLKERLAIQLIWLAFLTALGTLVLPEKVLSWTDIHRSPLYLMSLGYMSGMMLAYLCWNSLLYKGLKRWGILLSHLGVLVIIISTVVSFIFKTKGMIDLSVGGETSVFQERQGDKLLPIFHNIGATVKLQNFNVEWSDPEVYLRFYKNEYLEKSYSVSLNDYLNVKLEDMEISSLKYFTRLREETVVTADSEGEEAALKFVIKFQGKEQHNYLTADANRKGFIANNDGQEQLVFSTDQNVKRKDGIVYISARPLSFARGLSQWTSLTLPTSFMRGEAEIVVERVIPQSKSEERLVNDIEGPLNPAMLVHVKTPKFDKEIWLSPFMKDLQPLSKEWGMFLWLKKKEPVHFQSELMVLRPSDKAWKPFSLEVNKPLVSGHCRIYQGSFDRNNLEFSGLQVTCDPGRIGVKVGVWVMILGTFMLMLRRRLFKEAV